MLSKGLVGVAVVALAATGSRGWRKRGGGVDVGPKPLSLSRSTPVAAPSTGGRPRASKRRPFTKVKYVESNTATVAAQSEISGSLKCPRRSAAISGYFRNTPKRRRRSTSRRSATRSASGTSGSST